MSLNKRLINTGSDTIQNEPTGLTFLNQITYPNSGAIRTIYISPNGDYLFLRNNTTARFERYGFNTPYDITDITGIQQNVSIPAQQSRGWAFSTTGEQLLGGNYSYGNNNIYQKTISPWDISTASSGWSDTTKDTLGANSSSFDAFAQYSIDGTRYFHSSGAVGVPIGIYTLAAPHVLNSSASVQSFSYQDFENDSNLLQFTTDGLYLFLQAFNTIGAGSFKIYSLSSAWDLNSTKTYLRTITVNELSNYGNLRIQGNNLYMNDFNVNGGNLYHYRIDY